MPPPWPPSPSSRLPSSSAVARIPSPSPPSSEPSRSKIQVLVRSFWSENLDHEFSLIRGLVDRFPFVSMDTEFPGVVIHHYLHYSDPGDLYQTLEYNVDAFKLSGDHPLRRRWEPPQPPLPDRRFIWEFNFSDFDISSDDYAPNSINLLRN